MPTYDYKCSFCGFEQEVFQKITDEPLRLCSSCSKEGMRRGPGGGVGLSFQGSDYYINEYGSRKKESSCSEKKGCCPCSES